MRRDGDVTLFIHQSPDSTILKAMQFNIKDNPVRLQTLIPIKHQET